MEVKIGMNRTGVQMSPFNTEHMLARIDQQAPVENADQSMLAMVRSSYIAEADGIGTVPVPGTAKGLISTGINKLTGKNPEVFIDKLGERLAFERGGTRLYDALLTKCQTMADGARLPLDIGILRHFRDQEAAHFQMIADCMDELGADPTAQTPCADTAGVEALGLMQVLTDPRTTLSQGLNAILAAELVDSASWELLIKLSDQMGQAAMSDRFRLALQEENHHLTRIRTWLEQTILTEAS